jgi:UDP-4-amino-4,6-dideoxy-N-acetyl-beta-L-altrosamine transaminase
MSGFIPYGRQSISAADIEAVCNVLRSDFLTCGPQVEAFEARFAERIGAQHAVAVNSATAALHLAMLVAGVGRGDRVITSPNTFLASANCAAYAGATPDFADIDPVSHNLDPAALEQAWKPDVKAVVAVAYAGQPCDMPAIASVARRHHAIVIEDACHGVGGGFVHEGRAWKLGGHPWADMTVFSFHPVKTMTTGEGGMLVTDNAEWAQRARQLRSHGMEREPSRFQGLTSNPPSSILDPRFSEQGPWYYEMQELGYNYRITDIQCALGLSQLNRLDEFIARRREIVRRYQEALGNLPWLKTPGLTNPANREVISWHLYTVRVDFEKIGRTRTEVMVALKQQGIGTQVLYIPVHLQPWYRKTFGYGPGKCPVAENYYAHALSLPLYPAMTEENVSKVIQAVRDLA